MGEWNGNLTRATSISQTDGFVTWSGSNQGTYYTPFDIVFQAFTDSLTTTTNHGPMDITNLAIAGSVAGNNFNIVLNQADGITAPNSTSGSSISFGTLNADSASYNSRSITTQLTMQIPNGATLGQASGVLDYIYVYLLDNAGASQELAVSTEELWCEGMFWTTTAISAAASSRTTLYSTTARINVPIRFLGKFTVTQATAGVWLTAPSATESVVTCTSGVVANITTSGTPTALTTNTPVNAATITLPPGVWDITFGYGFIPTATTSTTDLVGAISTTSATLPATSFIGNLPALTDITARDRIQHISPTVWVSTSPITKTVAPYRHISTVSKSVFLVIQATFTASTLTGFGWIQAKKVG
jgi:hypothetical protein